MFKTSEHQEQFQTPDFDDDDDDDNNSDVNNT